MKQYSNLVFFYSEFIQFRIYFHPKNSSCFPLSTISEWNSQFWFTLYKGLVKPQYTCDVHKDFKSYQECLLNYKNWCIVICTFFSIPLCLFCWAVNLNLTWTYYFTGILIASSVVPIALSILWARATSYGMIAGVVGGCFAGKKLYFVTKIVLTYCEKKLF